VNIGGITSYIKLITKEMGKMPYRFFVGSSGGTQEKLLGAQGVETLRLNIRTKSELSPKVYQAVRPLVKFIREEKIDLIHAHTRVTQVLSWLVQRLSGIPYVSTCHGFYKRRLGRRLLPAWGDHVIAISKPVEGALTHSFRVPPEKVSTIFNAIDIDDLIARYQEKDARAIRKRLNIPPASRVIGIVARIVRDKGHEYFLRALKKLITSSHPDIKILIVGEGPYLRAIQALVQELKLENSACFMGNLEDITYALAVIDVFVLPAIWREGFGLAIIEAMAVRIPVVVTNIWSLNELVQDRVNGLLVEPKNVDDLKEAVHELLTDQHLYETVSARGSDMVTREFSISKMAERVDHLYGRVLAASRRGKSVSQVKTIMKSA